MIRLLPTLFLLLIVSCNPTDDPIAELPAPDPNLATFLRADGQATLFADALERTGLAVNTSINTRFAFVPTDEAFLASGIDPTTLPLAELTDLVAYHLVDGAAGISVSTSYEFTDVLTTNSCSGPDSTKLSLFLRSQGGIVFLNGNRARGVGESLDQPDGELLYIDHVLLPPTLQTMVQDLPEFSQLAALLADLPEITARLEGTAPTTFFAPVDLAVTRASTFLEELTAEQRTSLLYTHMLGENIPWTELFVSKGITLNEGQTLDLRPSNYELAIRYFQDPTDEQIYIPIGGIQTKNGVLYAIDKIVHPTSL